MPRPLPKQTVIEAVDIGEDEEEDYRDAEPITEWVKKAEFRASMGGAHIGKDGALSISIIVPQEDKYLALPLTDIQSVLMVFSVYEPVTKERNEDDDLDRVWQGS